ncbi:class II aldolase/adducin family protein [Gammaproteobacteria bacterium]|nr:class II aldolase/adducin family protein [Gammaproteobacteria bacterium]
MNETTFSTALFGPLCRDLYRDSNNFTRRPISAGEQRTRENLAALYRILDLYGMSDLANQEVSARIADEPNRYLVHPYGYFYDEITASCLIRIDEHGLPVDDAPWLNDGGQNLAKWIFNQREDIHYFIHGHCENVMAESCLPEGLLPLSQPAVYLSNLVGYIDYEFVEDETFGQKFMQHVAHHDILISRNHGYYWLGRTAEEAFFRAYYLRQACEV